MTGEEFVEQIVEQRREAASQMVQDPINPDYYMAHSIACINVIEAFDLGFHLGNAVKYILRAGKKGDAREDIKKAAWYINRWLEVNDAKD